MRPVDGTCLAVSHDGSIVAGDGAANDIERADGECGLLRRIVQHMVELELDGGTGKWMAGRA